MGVIQTGVAKRVAIKAESTIGTLPAAGSWNILRRVTSTPNLKKNTYTSAEIRSDYQIADMRHGSRRVEGSLSGEFSGGSYQAFLEALFRQVAQTCPTTGAVITIDSSAVDNSFNRSSGSFLADGFYAGFVIRASGFTTTGAANNAKNLRVVSVVAAKIIVAETLTTKAAGDTVTIVAPGKYIAVPLTGHTDTSFSMEEWNSIASVSKRFVGVKPSTGSIKTPATGLATLDFNFMGIDMQSAASAYATSPTAASSSRIQSAVDGSLRFNGADVAVCKGMNLDLNGNMSIAECIGSNLSPDVFAGSVAGQGQLTALFKDSSFLDWFFNEAEVQLHQVLKATSAVNSDFVSMFMGKVKSTANDNDDQQKEITSTVPFQFLLPDSATGILQTTILLQDSLFV